MYYNNFRRILRGLDKMHCPTKRLYKILYADIMNNLNETFELAKSSMNETPLKEKYLKNKIWIMWWQGLDEAPLLVVNNYRRLNRIFGSKNVILITKKNYKRYTNISPVIINKVKNGEITFTFWSDIVRYNLLFNNGGLWIDSTVIVSRKIKDYLEQHCNDKFISLSNVKDEYRFISNENWTGWFIGGQRDYKLFRFMNTFFEVYFENHNSQVDYFLVDDAVYFFYKENEAFRKNIKSLMLDWDCYLFFRNYHSIDTEKLFKLFNMERRFCVQKLTYKIQNNEPKSLYNLATNYKNIH